jgi:hypothetical protein
MHTWGNLRLVFITRRYVTIRYVRELFTKETTVEEKLLKSQSETPFDGKRSYHE